MTYARKTMKKAPYKKRNYRKRSILNQQVAHIAEMVALREQETKHHIKTLGIFVMLHNVRRRFTNNLFETSQRVSDGTGNRIGDQITLRGIKVYLQFLQEIDRPNVTFKTRVVKAVLD